MAIELVCSCGRLLRFGEPPAGGQARCPDCQALVTIESASPLSVAAPDPATSAEPPTATRKPLWAVMARHQSPSATPQQPGGPTATPVSNRPEPALPVTETSGPSSGRKGLWSVMQVPVAADAVQTIGPHPRGPIPFESVPAPGSPESNPNSEIRDPKSEIRNPFVPISNSDLPSDSLAAMIGIAEDEAMLAAQGKSAEFRADNSRRAIASVVLGGLSIPLSGLALINAAWSRLPATALGFVAILTGLIASQEIQRSGGRKTGRRLAIAGIVTGIMGSFLGPVVIARFGRPRDRR